MIFVVTTLYINEREKQIVRTRTWGYFLSQEEAEAAVVSFQNNIFENGYYNYALIEKTKEGFASRCEKTEWFKIENKNEDENFVVKKTIEPKFLRRYQRFWLG